MDIFPAIPAMLKVEGVNNVNTTMDYAFDSN